MKNTHISLAVPNHHVDAVCWPHEATLNDFLFLEILHFRLGGRMLILSLTGYSRASIWVGFELAVKSLSAMISGCGGNGIGSGSCTWTSQSGEKQRGRVSEISEIASSSRAGLWRCFGALNQQCSCIVTRQLSYISTLPPHPSNPRNPVIDYTAIE